MKGLMELLAKSGDDDSSADSKDLGSDSDVESNASDSSGFAESASQAMAALKAGDSEAFSDALRACIEMGR